MGQPLAVEDVAAQRGAVAVEVDDHHRGAADIEALGDVQQHAIVAVGLILPISVAEEGAMAEAAFVLDVEEGLVGAGDVARIGEGRGLERDDRGLVLLGRLGAGVDLLRDRRNGRADRAGGRGHAARKRRLARGNERTNAAEQGGKSRN